MSPQIMIIKLLVIFLLFQYSQSKAIISNNGYEDIVVAIYPDVSIVVKSEQKYPDISGSRGSENH